MDIDSLGFDDEEDELKLMECDDNECPIDAYIAYEIFLEKYIYYCKSRNLHKRSLDKMYVQSILSQFNMEIVNKVIPVNEFKSLTEVVKGIHFKNNSF
jgi:hypothetical protein